MEALNLHHLRYFWFAAREGGLTPAAKLLGITHSTLSTQIHALEESLGVPLFERVGRKLELTEAGQIAFRYAEEMFDLGRELVDELKRNRPSGGARVSVGLVDAVPRYLVRELLAPVLSEDPPRRIACVTDSFEALVGRLAQGELDIIVSDEPLPAGSSVRAFSHELGGSGVSFLGAPRFAAKTKGASAAQVAVTVPLILPPHGTVLRRSLETWFRSENVSPLVIAEVGDLALVKVLAADGVGACVVPSAVERSVTERYGLRLLARTTEVTERFWILSPERRVRDHATLTILEHARTDLFTSA